ncbi:MULTISPECIES: holo-ACP synthase [unclassified Achromobacter]|uniref:holo-ACP synthase n=1 Tax=unclassified Achromobacter TaxID=2626865 RepID=UPI000B51B1F9|nr:MULTISPECIES: holo-ACP synthase [unclassified Achromobacter]OWT77356.1 holo-ACP synthase [Achromobacter sp. HZ28]OWT78237.1 holo-ACP synthase [Achromobacter sp. HZ34]
MSTPSSTTPDVSAAQAISGGTPGLAPGAVSGAIPGAILDAPAATIAGIGMDLIRVDRIARALERHGDRFAEKILGEQELIKFHARRRRDARRGVLFLATRFAVKEAFSKAIGLGMRMPMAWRRVQTLNAPSGRPILVLAPELQAWYATRFGAAHVSLTDESDMAAAYVIVETRR